MRCYGVAPSCCTHTCSCSIAFHEGRAVCLSLGLEESPGLGSYQKADRLLRCCSSIYAYPEVNAALERGPASATTFALECAGFLPFTTQLLKKCCWMFRALWVCLEVKHRRSRPHSRVILQGGRREEHCGDKVGKILLLHCQKNNLLRGALTPGWAPTDEDVCATCH